MRKTDYLLFYVVGVLVALIIALPQDSPGYMDAEYYFSGGMNLVRGFGFQEMVLWNYLDDPKGLPHPSHTYWMPLVSLFSAVFMFFGDFQSYFRLTQLGFCLLAGLIPVLTAVLSFSLTREAKDARLAALLAVFSGFYLPYIPTSDSFGLSMILGAVFFILAIVITGDKVQTRQHRIWTSAFLGLVAGFIYLTRSEGVVWLLLAFFTLGLSGYLKREPIPQIGVLMLACLGGFLVIGLPWILRNYLNFGTFLSPVGLRPLWVLNYDELYAYPPSQLTFQRWWGAGWENILSSRLWALGLNLQTAIAVQGVIFLAPLVVVGFYQARKTTLFWVGTVSWVLIFLLMTLVFPFAGARGGFFHSGATLQPLFWAIAPLGLQSFLKWAARLRGWKIDQARKAFQVGLVILSLSVSILVVGERVIGWGSSQEKWDQGYLRYRAFGDCIYTLGVPEEVIVMVNNPPGFQLATGHPAIAIPYGNYQTVLTVAQRYGARYLVLEINQILGDQDLYASPMTLPGLQYLETCGEARIYEFTQP